MEHRMKQLTLDIRLLLQRFTPGSQPGMRHIHRIQSYTGHRGKGRAGQSYEENMAGRNTVPRLTNSHIIGHLSLTRKTNDSDTSHPSQHVAQSGVVTSPPPSGH